MENKNLIKKEVNVKGIIVECVQTEDQKIWVILSSLCNGLGIDKNSQLKRIKRDIDLLNTCTVKMTTQIGAQNREVICLQLEALPFFLTGIKSNMVKEEIRNNLVDFKLKAKDILAEAFLGKDNERSQEFFNSLGLEMNFKKLIKQNEILQSKVDSLETNFSIFRQENEQQKEQLYFLVKRFDIYNNEDCLYTRLIDDFNAKMYNSCNIRNKHYTFWSAISDWLGLDFNKLLAEKNKKQYLKNKIGMRRINEK